MRKKIMKKFMDEVKRLASKYGSKTSYDLVITESGTTPDYTWKDIESGERIKTPALYMVVRNFKDYHYHIVALATNPKSGELAIWCSDKELHQKFGIERSACGFWREGTCKHVQYALYHLLQKDGAVDKAVEEFVKLLSQQSGATASTSSSRQEEVERILSVGVPALIVGPTGSGKTYSVLKTLLSKQKAGEVEFSVINFTSGMEDTDLLAKFVPTPDGKWEVRDGELWRAFKEASQLPDGKKYVIVLEELTRATPKALNVLVKAMDGVGKNYRLQNFVTGEELIVPKSKLRFIGLANLGASYSGTEELDPALMRRFLICRFWDYDTATERELLLKLGLEEADKLMRFVQSQRDSYRRGQFPYPIDTGTLKSWVKLKKETGMSWWESFEFTCLYRIVDRDAQGFPDEVQVQSLKELMEDLSLE